MYFPYYYKACLLSIVSGVEFMVAVTAPFYCQLCSSFASSVDEAQWHLLSVYHNDKYKVRCLVLIHCLLTVLFICHFVPIMNIVRTDILVLPASHESQEHILCHFNG